MEELWKRATGGLWKLGEDYGRQREGGPDQRAVRCTEHEAPAHRVMALRRQMVGGGQTTQDSDPSAQAHY